PNPPTLTFDHLTPPPSHNDNNDTSYRSPSPNQPHLAPLASPLKLFQSTYDTYTRQHLNEIVDLVDSTNTLNTIREGGDSSEEGFLGDEGRRRSCKRIKLSPPRDFEDEEQQEGTVRYEQEEEGKSRSWVREEEDVEASRRSEGLIEEGTPTRSMVSKRRTPRTSSEHRRRRRETPRRSLGDRTTPASSRRKSFSVVVEEAEEDEVENSQLLRHERVRDRREEAMELMEKIRKRSEERENRRKNDQPAQSNRLRSPPKIALLSPRPRSPIPPSELASDSPPPLPHLAAAASASIRSVLGSPAPSYQTQSPRIIASPALVPTPSKNVELGFEKKFPSSIVPGLEHGGSIGKRRFTKGSMSASTADHLNREEEKEELRPSPFLASVPP
ncbi:Jnm1p, partial [Sporobolomyces salmoneus]|uniref:Jnm1p n=1 Tax=Sporobolomyces salmoneus TaxID=183962 RepID=UPI00317FCECE